MRKTKIIEVQVEGQEPRYFGYVIPLTAQEIIDEACSIK